MKQHDSRQGGAATPAARKKKATPAADSAGASAPEAETTTETTTAATTDTAAAASGKFRLLKNHGLASHGKASEFYCADTEFDAVEDAELIAELVRSGAHIEQ